LSSDQELYLFGGQSLPSQHLDVDGFFATIGQFDYDFFDALHGHISDADLINDVFPLPDELFTEPHQQSPPF
jgi:hypothetical protein